MIDQDPDTPPRGVIPAKYITVDDAGLELEDGEVVEESLSCFSVNGKELATFMCSPTGLEQLGIGFLYNESLIEGIDEVASLHISDHNCVDIWLTHDIAPPERTIITAGCGGGVTFDDLSAEHPPLDSTRTTTTGHLAGLMKQLHLGAALYRRSRGIHTAILADETQVRLQVEDVGRHNCIDKIAGAALQAGIDTRDHLLLSSGRISSEMLNKARRMGIPIIASRTSPTSLSVALAEAWNITIVAYLRGSRMRVYTHPQRILTPDQPLQTQQMEIPDGTD